MRDILVNPKSEQTYVLGSFWEERLNTLWTYKVGQARCAFLEETFGKGTIQYPLKLTAADGPDGMNPTRSSRADLLRRLQGPSACKNRQATEKELFR